MNHHKRIYGTTNKYSYIFFHPEMIMNFGNDDVQLELDIQIPHGPSGKHPAIVTRWFAEDCSPIGEMK